MMSQEWWMRREKVEATMGNQVWVNQVVCDHELFDLMFNQVNRLVKTDTYVLVMIEFPRLEITFGDGKRRNFTSPVVLRIVDDAFFPERMQFDVGFGRRFSLYEGTVPEVIDGRAKCLAASAITTRLKSGATLHRVYYGGSGDPNYFVDLGAWSDLIIRAIAVNEGSLFSAPGSKIIRF